jgi:hypothetical protein
VEDRGRGPAGMTANSKAAAAEQAPGKAANAHQGCNAAAELRRCRHVIVPEFRGGATVMDSVFDDDEDDLNEGNEEAETS